MFTTHPSLQAANDVLALPPPTMAGQDLRKKLFENIHKTGLADKLKSQLRSRLIAELRLRSRNFSTRHETAPPSSILQRAVDSLLLDYLRIQRYEFTLSVFLPDSGLNTQQPFSETDILRVLRLDHPTPFSRALKQAVEEFPKDGLLRNILSCLAKVGDPITVDMAVQTRRPVDSLNGFENRMIAYQKECDDRAKSEVELQMKRFREHETMKLRDEEKGKFKRDVQRLKTEFEKMERERTEKFTWREEETKQKFERMEKNLKAAELLQQQQLHTEIATAKAREETLKREQELNARAAKLECEIAERKREEVELRLRQLELQREENAQTFREEAIRLQTAMDHEKSTLLSDLKVQRANLEGERNLLQEKLRVVTHQATEHDHLVRELEESRRISNEAQSELQDVRKKSIELASQVSNLTTKLQEESKNTKLEYEIFTLKKQVLEAERRHIEQKPQTEEIARLRRPELKWQRECQALVTKLDYETSRNQEQSKRLDDEILRNKELQRETAELRMLLHQAQTALTNQQNRLADSMRCEYQTDGRSRLMDAMGYLETASYTGGYIGDPVAAKHDNYYRDLGTVRAMMETVPELRHEINGTTEVTRRYPEERKGHGIGFVLPGLEEETPNSKGYVKDKSHRELVSEGLDRTRSRSEVAFTLPGRNGNRNELQPDAEIGRAISNSVADPVRQTAVNLPSSIKQSYRIEPASLSEALGDRPLPRDLHEAGNASQVLNDRSEEYLRPSSGIGLVDPLIVPNDSPKDESLRRRSLRDEEFEGDRKRNIGMANSGGETEGNGSTETREGTQDEGAMKDTENSKRAREAESSMKKREDENRRREEKEEEEKRQVERMRQKEAQDQEERRRRQEKLLAEREEQESIRRQQRVEETKRRKQQEEIKMESDRLREELERQKRQAEEQKQNEEKEKMQRLQKAAEDPVLQRYMAVMKEKREREGVKGGEKEGEEAVQFEEEEAVIQQGSTEADLSVPNESEGDESSDLW